MKPFLVVAGVLLVVAMILVGLDFLGNLIGVAWMTRSALTRRKSGGTPRESWTT